MNYVLKSRDFEHRKKQQKTTRQPDVWEGAINSARSPSSLYHCWCPPPLCATQHANGGHKEGREHANCVCMLPPFLLCAPHLSAPWLAPPLCTKCAEWGTLLPLGSHHPASTQTGNVGWNPKGAHPLLPLAPAHSNRTASVGPPTAPLIPPPFMHKWGPHLHLNKAWKRHCARHNPRPTSSAPSLPA